MISVSLKEGEPQLSWHILPLSFLALTPSSSFSMHLSLSIWTLNSISSALPTPKIPTQHTHLKLEMQRLSYSLDLHVVASSQLMACAKYKVLYVWKQCLQGNAELYCFNTVFFWQQCSQKYLTSCLVAEVLLVECISECPLDVNGPTSLKSPIFNHHHWTEYISKKMNCKSLPIQGYNVLPIFFCCLLYVCIYLFLQNHKHWDKSELENSNSLEVHQ